MATALELPTVDTLARRAARASGGASCGCAGGCGWSSCSSWPRMRCRARGHRRRFSSSSIGGFASAYRSALSCWCSAWRGCLAFLGIRAFRRYQASRLDELTLAMTLDRHRPGTGQQIADVLQLPELLDESGADGLAGDGATGGSACDARPWPARTGARSGTASARPWRLPP